jgi:hypothetical protein
MTSPWDGAARLGDAELALRQQGENDPEPNVTSTSPAQRSIEPEAFRATWDAGATTAVAGLASELNADHDGGDHQLHNITAHRSPLILH